MMQSKAVKCPFGATNCDCSTKSKEHLLQHVRDGIPTKISYDFIWALPTRANFVDHQMETTFVKHIENGKPIIFMPNYVLEKNDWVNTEESNGLQYRIYIFGVLPDGNRACVVLDKVPVYLDIMVPDSTETCHFVNLLKEQMFKKGLKYTNVEVVKQFRLHGFQQHPRDYVRVHFRTLNDRRDLLRIVNAHNKNATIIWETAADDTGMENFYFPKVAREYRFKTADWNRFESYYVDNDLTSGQIKYTFVVDVGDYKPLSKIKRREILEGKGNLKNVIDKDPLLVTMWDIETHREIQNGMIPTPADHDYTIFMMCSAHFWHWSDKPLLTVCCVDKEENARQGIDITIVCGTEDKVLLADIAVKAAMNPDLMGAFNGGNFDWPLTREKLRRMEKLVHMKHSWSALPPARGKYADTEASVLKYCFRSESIKIDAETKHELECVANIPGIIDTDVSPVFAKLYTRMEVRKAASLNFYLTKNNLDTKEDMPYKTMFKIYERAKKLEMAHRGCVCDTPTMATCITCKEVVPELDCKRTNEGSLHEAEYSTELLDELVTDGRPKCCHCAKRPRNAAMMAEVGYYCVIDCVRPQQLYVKRTIIPDKRELSNMSYVSLYDSFFRADGMKVRNVIGSYCHKNNIAFSNAKCSKGDHEKDHYPGAWVFPPERGLNNTRPITGLDFASLYPSLMMAYNLSPDMVVRDPEVARDLLAKGYLLHRIEPFQYEKGAEKGKAENKYLTISGWTVRHRGVHSRKDTTIAEKMIKYETYSWTEDGQQKSVKIPAREFTFVGNEDIYADNEVLKSRNVISGTGLENNVEIRPGASRKVTYEPVRGRDVLPGERIGIFPFILKKIFDRRVPVKAEFVRLTKLKEQMELKKVRTLDVEIVDSKGEKKTTTVNIADVSFQIAKTESKQKALKVLANTFYGESGNYRSPIYELLVAAGITCAGQMNIKSVAGFVGSKGFKAHYGDSVTGDTPILCRFTHSHGLTICYQTIESLGANWSQYGDKQACCPSTIEVWTEQGWTKIKRVIRHYTDKAIYRIATLTGIVDVTSDHSLLDENAIKIRPIDVKIGTKLLHSDLPNLGNTTEETINLLEYGSKLDAARAYYRYSQFGNIVIDHVDGKYQLRILEKLPTDCEQVCDIQIITQNYSQYVYDLETENNHFAAGIGRMIVHNTDSLYITCPDNIYAADDAKFKDEIAKLRSQFGKPFSDEMLQKIANPSYMLPNLELVPTLEDSQMGELVATEYQRLLSDAQNGLVAARAAAEKSPKKAEKILAAANSRITALEKAKADGKIAQTAYMDRFVAARVRYWTAMVEKTMHTMNVLKEEVSDFLLSTNGTCFLNMAYEEVGFPTVLCGKKKYFMTPHVETINFYPDELFIRGIDIIKQGQTAIAKLLGDEIMRRALAPENVKDIYEITIDVLGKYFATKWPASMFAQTGRYRPHKKNVTVHTFVARMRAMQAKFADRMATDPESARLYALYEPPEADDKFEYVVVKKDQTYTPHGTKIDMKKGDHMEYTRVYKWSQETPNKLEIDLGFYVESAILGLFARFIAYKDDFQPPADQYDPQDKEQYKAMDKFCIDAAIKHLRAICYNHMGFDPEAARQTGRDYKQIYRNVNKVLKQDLTVRTGGASVFLDINLKAEDGDARARSTRIVDQFRDMATEMSANCANYGAEFIKVVPAKTGISPYKLRRMYNGTSESAIAKWRIKDCTAREKVITDELYREVPEMIKIVLKYEKSLIMLIDDLRKEKSGDSLEITPDEINDVNKPLEAESIKKCYNLLLKLVAVYKVRARAQSIIDELARAKEYVEPPQIAQADIRTANIPKIDTEFSDN